jgi:hypothetical protein
MVPLVAALLPIDVIAGAMFAGSYIFVSCFLYLRYVKKVKPKYPLSPPSPEQDVYFPRTNIPRPIYKDHRDHPEYFDKKKKKKIKP